MRSWESIREYHPQNNFIFKQMRPGMSIPVPFEFSKNNLKDSMHHRAHESQALPSCIDVQRRFFPSCWIRWSTLRKRPKGELWVRAISKERVKMNRWTTQVPTVVWGPNSKKIHGTKQARYIKEGRDLERREGQWYDRNLRTNGSQQRGNLLLPSIRSVNTSDQKYVLQGAEIALCINNYSIVKELDVGAVILIH